MICLYKFIWFFFSFLESSFWYVKRKLQLSQLEKCGQNVWIGRNCHFNGKYIKIGNDVSIGKGAIIQSTNSKIIIGNHVMFGPNVSIHGGNHRIDILGRYMKSIKLNEKRKGIDDDDVVIDDDVWIGANAIILKGVTIGKGSVIGAGVTVYKSVPSYSIVTSAEMKIRPRFSSEEIIKHENLLCNENQ